MKHCQVLVIIDQYAPTLNSSLLGCDAVSLGDSIRLLDPEDEGTTIF
jgi:hypothetical protein